MEKILFVCEKNSARSRIAEAFCRALSAPQLLQVESAGLYPGSYNPLAARVMNEIGIDITTQPSQDVFQLFREGRFYTHVITVCDHATAQQCPLFPGAVQRGQWDVPDIATLEGSEAEQLEAARRIRNTIRDQVLNFLSEHQLLEEQHQQ